MDYDRDFEEGFENTSLGAIYYRHHVGTGTKLIFLYGLGGTTRVWTRLMEYMPEALDIFLIDLLGHGKSDAPQIEYTVSTQFQALREFIALRNNGDSYIYGHSYGGWIAAYYASQPYTCKGIILEDAVGLKAFFDEISKNSNLGEYRENEIKSAMSVDGNKEYVIRSIVESSFMEDDQLTAETLAMIKVPALIIWGSEDRTIDRKFANVFAEKIKSSRLEIVEGAGHNSHYTHPKEVSELILEFIRSHG